MNDWNLQSKEHVIHWEIFAVKIIVVFLCVGSVMATMTAETDLMSATAVRNIGPVRGFMLFVMFVSSQQ